MFFLKTDAQTLFAEKRSKFITNLFVTQTPEQALEKLEQIRREHREAAHNVYAYRLAADNVTRHSDDGEPHGTAGMPVLEIFRHADVFNFTCVVTRYFGGIKLGTGGLTRAYAAAAKQALDAAGVYEHIPTVRGTVTVPYNLYDLVSKEIENIENTVYAEQIEIFFRTPESEFENLAKKITDLTNGKAEIVVDNKRQLCYNNF